MIRFTETLYEEMQASLQELSMGVYSFVQRAERSFQIAESHLLKLREYILEYTFEDNEEEILFFKSIKPRFHKELLYWAEVVRIETGRPTREDGNAKRHTKNLLKEIQGHIVRNHFLYEYYKLGRTHMDEILYLRNSSFTPLLPTDRTGLEPAFSTLAGNILAGIMAMEEIAVWLTNTTESVNIANPTEAESPGLVWTGSKAQLIELVYALQSYGVFNTGN
jgi:RteC protein.